MKHLVLIPVYNDWKSLEKLISKLKSGGTIFLSTINKSLIENQFKAS